MKDASKPRPLSSNSSGLSTESSSRRSPAPTAAHRSIDRSKSNSSVGPSRPAESSLPRAAAAGRGTDTLREWSNAPGTCGLDNSLWTAATDETRELVIHLNSNTPTSRRRHLSPEVHVAHPAAQVPSLIALRSGTGVALITATVLASMAGFLDASVVNVAVPAIAKDLGASVAALQWTLTGYLLTAAALLLVAGALADSYGRRRVLVTGLLVMLAASAG